MSQQLLPPQVKKGLEDTWTCETCGKKTPIEVGKRCLTKRKCDECIAETRRGTSRARVNRRTAKLKRYERVRMRGICNQKCTQFQTTKNYGRLSYAAGLVLCHNCGWLKREAVKSNMHCKCCGKSVRTRPRNNEYAAKFQAQKQLILSEAST